METFDSLAVFEALLNDDDYLSSSSSQSSSQSFTQSSPLSSPQSFTPLSPSSSPHSLPPSSPHSPLTRPQTQRAPRGFVQQTIGSEFPWAKLQGKKAYDAMVSHYRSERSPRYTCPYTNCGKASRSKKDHTDHINRAHLCVALFECEYCAHRLYATKERNRHMRIHHPHLSPAAVSIPATPPTPPAEAPQIQTQSIPGQGERHQWVSYHTPNTKLLTPQLLFGFQEAQGFFPSFAPSSTNCPSDSVVSLHFNPPYPAPWEREQNSPVPYLDFYIQSDLPNAIPPIFRWINSFQQAQSSLRGLMPTYVGNDDDGMTQHLQTTLYSNDVYGNSWEPLATLGYGGSLEYLYTANKLDAKVVSKTTKRNLLHIALTNDSLPIFKLGLKYKVGLTQIDAQECTPRDLFNELPSNSACKTYLRAAARQQAGLNPSLLRRLEEEEKKHNLHQTEDVKLQGLFSSNFSKEGWASFVSGLQQNEFKLSLFGAREILFGVTESLGFENSTRTVRSQSLLKGLTAVLEMSPAMVRAIGQEGPEYIHQRIPLASFLSSLPSKDESCVIGLEFARGLVELCPHFADYNSFIQFQEGSRKAALQNVFKEIQPAKVLFTANELSRRLQKKLSDKILSSLSGDQPAISSTDSEETFLALTVDSVKSSPLAFSEERQKEILDQTERLALAFIYQTESSLKSAIEEKNDARVKELLDQRTRGINKLVDLHRNRRSRRAGRYREKLEILNQRLPTLEGEVKELIETFLHHTALHAEGVATLGQIYDDVLSSAIFLNPSKELCFIDSLIGELYNISVSLVITGPISVGKSTIVNCIVGRNISPQRTETMTAIPVRYLHTPHLKDPEMLVPFASQLNAVIEKLRGLIEQHTLEHLKALQKRIHLATLLDVIADGLVIQDRYTGIQNVREASANIHDLFRLAVDDVFEDSLVVDLPLDWSQGLDTYLTVNINFPGLDVLSNLVEFSVVDTPGINESGVKKLRLNNTIRDALRACKYAAMVVTATGFADTGLLSLRKMFHEIKSTLKTPVMAYVTFAEDIQQKDVAEKKQNICHFVTSETQERIYEPDNIFLVSPKRKNVGEQMIAYINEFQRKPEFTDAPEAANLAEEWALFSGFGDSPEEKLEYYRELKMEKLLDRSKKLAAASGMDLPLHHMVSEAIKNGIPTSVRHGVNSAIQKVEPIVKKLASNISSEAFKRSLERGNTYLNKLVRLQEDLQEELAAKSQTIKSDILKQGRDLFDEIGQWNAPISASNAGFLAILFRHLKGADDIRVLHLLNAKDSLSFSSKEDAEKVIAVSTTALKKALEEALLTKNEGLADELRNWGATKKTQVRNTFEEIGRTYSQALDIKVNEKILSSMQVNLATSEKLSLGYDPSTQLIIRKMKKKAGFQDYILPILGLKHRANRSYVVEPSEVRAHLQQTSHSYIEMTETNLTIQVENLLSRSLKPFIQDNINEILRLKNIVEETVLELESNKTQSLKPRKDMADKIGATLASCTGITITAES